MMKSPIVIAVLHGALSGFAAAAAVDLHVFLGWKRVDDFAQWDGRTALLRWTQGTVAGALMAAGWGSVLGA